MKILLRSCSLAVVLVWATSAVGAQDYRVEKIDTPAPAEDLAPEIADTLAPHGLRVIRGTSRTLCEIWMARQWPVASAEPADGTLYPFAPGQLIGVVRFTRDGSDFRDQDIESGVYTMRFALQPVDGAHVGTSVTRDFLLLVSAKHDRTPDIMEYDSLTEASADAAQTTHPAMLALKPVVDNGEGSGSLRFDDSEEWWIARLQGQIKAGEETKDLMLDLVVVGHADE